MAAAAHMAAASSLAGVRSRYREVRTAPVGRAGPVGQEVLVDREGLGGQGGQAVLAVLGGQGGQVAPADLEGREALAAREDRANREAPEDHTRSRPHR